MHGWLLPLMVAVPLGTGAAQPPDFEAWFRGFRQGNAVYEPTLLRPLIRAGSLADGARVLRILTQPWPPGSEACEVGAAVQANLLEDLGTMECSLGVQAAIVDWLRRGVRRLERRGEAPAWEHESPALAVRLVPLLGRFHRSRFRGDLESFCRGRDASLVVAAGAALVASGSRGSFGTVAESLRWLPGPTALTAQVDHVARLLASGEIDLAAQERALDLVLHRIGSDGDLRVREALVRLLHHLRGKRAIPTLISELASTHALLVAGGAAPTGLSFYLYEVHDVLEDLTGFWAPASSPERWQEFWEREGDRLTLAPARQGLAAGRTRAPGFFGVPVRGRRVLFVLDTSGSMGSALPEHGVTRLQRAKQELRAAVAGMDPEAEFNVILFSDQSRRLSDSFAPASAARLRGLEEMLTSTMADGGTSLRDALRRGMAGRIHETTTPQRRSIDEVFVLSDGAPRSDPRRILADVARWNVGRAARVHAIYLGGGDENESTLGSIPHGRSLGPLRFMQELAAENGGEFRSPH